MASKRDPVIDFCGTVVGCLEGQRQEIGHILVIRLMVFVFVGGGDVEEENPKERLDAGQVIEKLAVNEIFVNHKGSVGEGENIPGDALEILNGDSVKKSVGSGRHQADDA